MSLVIIPNNCKTEAQLMAFSGRQRKLLIDTNNVKAAEHAEPSEDPEFIEWHMGYFMPLFNELNGIWGPAHNDARFGNYGQGVPPWFDADPDSHWNQAGLVYPPGVKLDAAGEPVNKGSKQSFIVRLGEKMGFWLNPQDPQFVSFMPIASEAKKGCGFDAYWDGGIVWP